MYYTIIAQNNKLEQDKRTQYNWYICVLQTKWTMHVLRMNHTRIPNLVQEHIPADSRNLIFAWPCIVDTNNVDNQLDTTITVYY